MGLKEDLIVDWKNKVIEYQDKRFYVLEQFDYKKTNYLYGIDVSTVGSEQLKGVFLYKVDKEMFEHVESEELFEELIIVVSGKMSAEMIKEDLKKYKDSLK